MLKRIDWVRMVPLSVLLLAGQLLAQNLRETSSPGVAPGFEFSAGYVLMNMTSANSSSLLRRGVDATGVMQFTPRLGAMLDVTATRAGITGTNHNDWVLSALIGPEFFLIDNYRTNIFVHALAGSALVDSAIATGSGSEIKGYVTRFSYAFGGGVEFTLKGPLAFRVVSDYQRTTFVNTSLALARQNNVRATTSLVYRFGSR